jgi:hypothetical protein
VKGKIGSVVIGVSTATGRRSLCAPGRREHTGLE